MQYMQYICIVNNQKRKVRSRLWPSVTSRKPTSGMLQNQGRRPKKRTRCVHQAFPHTSKVWGSIGRQTARNHRRRSAQIRERCQKNSRTKEGAFLRCSGCNYEISEQQFLSKLPDHIKMKNLNDFRSIASKVTCSQCGLKGEAKVIFKGLTKRPRNNYNI